MLNENKEVSICIAALLQNQLVCFRQCKKGTELARKGHAAN